MARLRYDIDLETRQAVREAQKLETAAGDVEEALEDVESAGKKVADAIERSADDAIAEIDATRRAVEALDRELGDVDFDTREVVTELKRVGLTAQDIEADAEDLAAAVRRVDDVKLHSVEAGFADVDQALGRTRDETGRTRDVMTGFAGGVAGEIPGISESMGPVTEGLGQLVEGALEAEVGFKNMALAGLGIGGVLGGLMALNESLDRTAATDAWADDQVAAYNDVLGETVDLVDTIRTKLEAEPPTMQVFGNEVEILPFLNRAGLSVQKFSEVVAGGQESIDEWGQSLRDAGVSGDLVRDVTVVMETELAALTEAQQAAAASNEFFAETQDGVNDKYERFLDNEDPTRRLTEELGRMSEAMSTGVAPAVDDVQRVMDELNISAEDAIRLAGDYGRELADTETRIDDIRTQLRDFTTDADNVPEHLVTRIEAEIERGDLDAAEATLEVLVRKRYVNIVPRVSNPVGAGSSYLARGGVAGPDGAIAGEHGRPELVTQPTAVAPGAKVTGEAETRRLFENLSRGGGDRVTNIYVGAGHTPSDIDELIRRHAEREG